MANEFLNTPILPGSPVDKKRHLHLSIVFIGVALLIIIVLVIYYFSADKPSTPTVTGRDDQSVNRALAQLGNAKPVSQAEVNAALKQLSAEQTKVTQSDIDEAVRQLKTK